MQGVGPSAAVLKFESKQQLMLLPAGFICAWSRCPVSGQRIGQGGMRGVASTMLSGRRVWRRSLRAAAAAGSNNEAVISAAAAAAAMAVLAKTIIRTDRA